jgi:hypothetical protein
MVNPEDVLETVDELGLFSVRKVRNAATLEAMEDGTAQADAMCGSDADSESGMESEHEADSELDDSDLEPEDRRRIENEREFEALYNEYLSRTGQIKKREKKGKKIKKVNADGETVRTCVLCECLCVCMCRVRNGKEIKKVNADGETVRTCIFLCV